MKYLMNKLLFSFLIVMGSYSTFAQDAETMHAQREILTAKITTYLEKNSGYELSSKEEAQFVLFHESDDHHEGSVDIDQMREKFIRTILIDRFLSENPDVNNSIAKTTGFSYPDPCYRGDFESGALITFEGYWHAGTNNMQCDQIPLDVPGSGTYFPMPMTGVPEEFKLTNNVPDPNVPASALYQTNGGSSHALRINPDDGGGQDISVLRKNFGTPTTGDQIVSFSSAIVLEFPHNSVYDPFMTARILDATGTVVGGPICITPTTPGIDWTPFTVPGKNYVWMDWKCFQIPYYGVMGSNYVLEVSVGDCGYSAHGGYAYIDDICNKVCHPVNMDCCDALAGQILSWSEVPGAVSYDVDIFYNDPECCTTTAAPLGMMYNTTDNMYMVSTAYSDCFSWRVRAVYADGTRSGFTERLCDCSPEPVNPCETPINLGCQLSNTDRTLFWDAVPGALGGYQVMITYNDPMCPGCTGSTYTETISTMVNSISVIDPSTCFSWKVRSMCSSWSNSDWSESVCACSFSTMPLQGSSHVEHIVKGLETLVVPNPADEFVSITLKSEHEELTSPSQLVIFDATGGKVLETKIRLNTEKRINVSNLKPGMYIYNVIHNDVLMSSGKLLIE